MFDLIIGGKKYPVADGFDAMEKSAEKKLIERFTNKENNNHQWISVVIDAFSVCTGIEKEESWTILRNLPELALLKLSNDMFIYVTKLPMSDAMRDEFDKKIKESSEKKTVATAEVRPKSRKRTMTQKISGTL